MGGALGGENMLKVLIVGDKEGQRIQPLLKMFLNDERFDVENWDSVYLKSFSDIQLIDSGFSVEKSIAYTLRELTLGEIGCSLAHNRAREYLAANELGGVILEDDARIPNLDYFFDSASLFLDTIKIPAVMNFSSRNKLEVLSNTLTDIPSIRKTIVHSPGNVGYVLNKSGAEMLSSTDYRLCMMCDWPYSKINKYALAISAVAHGDGQSKSLVDPENLMRRGLFSWKKNWPNRIKLFSFYWYIKHRHNFMSLKEYINVMLVPRIIYQIYRSLRTTILR
jgi:hypothetical protein